MLPRNSYMNEIRQILGTPLIKVLVGMRRVGKSTILAMIQEELLISGVHQDQIIHINFELLENEPYKNYRELYRHVKSLIKTESKYYVFLDEIQEVELFEKAINSLLTEGQTEIFITGSNSRLSSRELATELTGRYYSIEILPLSFRELYGLDSKLDMDGSFRDYLNYGGLPGILPFSDKHIALGYVKDMYSSILLRDIVSRYSIRDVDLLERFLKFIIQNIGQTFSASSVTAYLKSEGRQVSRETIYTYLEASKNAFLIYGIPRYDLRGKAILRTNEKYFINDLGIRSLFFDNEKDIAQTLENIVFLELRRRRYDINVGKFDEREVDFIAVRQNQRIYVQVAYLLADSATVEREFSVLEKISDNNPKFVLSMDKIHHSRDGITHMNIVDFLMGEEI